MDRLVFYSEGLKAEVVKNVLNEIDIFAVYSQRRLIESLVDDPSLVGAMINVVNMTPEWTEFLISASRSFPLLPILIVRPAGSDDCPEGYACMADDVSDQEIREAVDNLIGGATRRDRRKHHRFQWPLRAEISGGDGTMHRISEIGAGGAYLEPVGSVVGAGESCEIEIHFQNFKMLTRCIILDPRHTSSRRSAGFGVRFDNLSEEARTFINGIVQDALIEILVDPDARPAIPTLDENEDLLSIGDEFALT